MTDQPDQFWQSLVSLDKNVSVVLEKVSNLERMAELQEKASTKLFELNREQVKEKAVQAVEIKGVQDAVGTIGQELKEHREDHWKFAGFLITSTGVLVGFLNYLKSLWKNN